MADAMQEIEVDTKFSKLLIRVRLDMEEEFVSGRKKKSVLWGRVLQIMKEKNPNVNQTKDQINRKFLNLVTTYRRIKARNKESGRSATSWAFFDDFDEIYGTRHSIYPPTENLMSSLDDSTNSACNGDYYEPCDNSPESSDSSPAPPAKKRKRKNEVVEYLEEESLKEQKRHEEVLAIEERKLRMEEKRINAIMELKDVLEKALTNK